MTNPNCIASLDRLQEIDSLANVLLSMVQHYDFPESVELIIEELNDKTESLKLHGLLNQVTLMPTLARIPVPTA
jgi:hypothetical protein